MSFKSLPEDVVGLHSALWAIRQEAKSGAALDCEFKRVWNSLNDSHRATLKQILFRGPTWDGEEISKAQRGDIISKAHRDDLITMGLAVRCCYLGEQGHVVALPLAFCVYQAGIRPPSLAQLAEIKQS